MKRLSPFTLAVATMLSAAGARAQTPPTSTDLAARRELLRHAQEAANAQRHAEALDLAQRAAAINMTPSVRAFIGQEHRALGQLAEAMGDADSCVHEVQRDPTLPQHDVILASCRTLLAELTPVIGRLTVHVDPPVEGLHVRVGPADLNPAFYGLPYIVTPGAVLVEATAPGRDPFRQIVTVAAGATGDVTVAMRPAASLAPPTDRSSASPGPGSSATLRRAQAVRGGPPIPAVIGAGVGVLSLAASLVFFVLRNGAESTFEQNQCVLENGTWHCFGSSQALQQLGDARTWNTATDVTLIAGGGLVLAGVAWWAIAAATGHTESAAPRASLEVVPTTGGVLVGFGGAL